MRDLSKTLTSMSIETCKGICNRKILHFLYYYEYGGVCFLVLTGEALLMSPKGQNASRDGLVKLWDGAFIICNTITL